MLLTLLLACAAIRPTVTLGQLEEAYHDAEAAGGEEAATYEFVKAEQYRLKAQEEWGYSAYGSSEALSRKGIEAANKAEKQALYGADDADAEERFELIERIEDDSELLDDGDEESP